MYFLGWFAAIALIVLAIWWASRKEAQQALFGQSVVRSLVVASMMIGLIFMAVLIMELTLS